MSAIEILPIERIQSRILVLRGVCVLFGAVLAKLDTLLVRMATTLEQRATPLRKPPESPFRP